MQRQAVKRRENNTRELSESKKYIQIRKSQEI